MDPVIAWFTALTAIWFAAIFFIAFLIEVYFAIRAPRPSLWAFKDADTPYREAILVLLFIGWLLISIYYGFFASGALGLFGSIADTVGFSVLSSFVIIPIMLVWAVAVFLVRLVVSLIRRIA